MTATPLEHLELERQAWLTELSRAAEAWVAAKRRGEPTDELDERMRRAERESRRLERRIRRRRRQTGRDAVYYRAAGRGNG